MYIIHRNIIFTRLCWGVRSFLTGFVGNKAKGQISKRVFQEKKVNQIFRNKIFQILTFVFLKHPFLDSPFCLITDVF